MAFRCAESHGSSLVPPDATAYVAVTGPGTAWPGKKPTRLKDIRDGTSNTVVVVEIKDSDIHWMEPRDLSVGQMSPSVNPTSGQGISSHHTEGATVLFVDGSVRYLQTDLDQKTLDALLTRDGGEDVDMDDFYP